MYALTQKARPHPQVVATKMDDKEMVLLHMETQIYFSLNATGLRIWDGVQQGKSFGEISQQLCEEFHVDPEQATTSVLNLINELSQQNLIQIEE